MRKELKAENINDFKKAELARDMIVRLEVFLNDDKSEFYYHNKIDGE